MSELVDLNQKESFKHALTHLLGINTAGFGLSIANEALNHSALGFTQAAMEGVDSVLAVGLTYSHTQDILGKHKRASNFRQGLYWAHIGIAGLGIAESARLMNEGSQPTLANIAISGIVAVLNMHYIRHRRKHQKHIAHTKTPTVETAFVDPTEVIQDEKLVNSNQLHKLNELGIIAIAKTNVAESIGGLAGSLSYAVSDQGPAVFAIGSSLAVIQIMLTQIIKDRKESETVK